MPTFDEMLAQVLDLLQREGRVSYRALKRRFALDEEYLEDLKAEIIEAKQLAVDEGGAVLVWSGRGGRENPEQPGRPDTDARGQARDPRPVSYTPKHLAERILAEREAMEGRGAPEGERKTITALFADLKGSTALIEDLDPEEARALIDPALQLMMEAVHRYEGYVAQSLGDGIFALFGAPIAHEDHAQRALYAALRMQEELKRYGHTLRQAGGVPLSLRVGINTGEVVVRSIRTDDLHMDYVPVGHSTNIAARMESLAMPGSVVVSAHTHRLTEGYFEFRALGETQVKGVTDPLHLYEVAGVGPLKTRLQVAARRGLARFVGRQRELEQLARAFEQTRTGQGQIVGVIGEPGVGKSRLFHEFKLRYQHSCLVLETFSVSHGKAYAYLPLVELLKHYFQFTLQDDERTRREKIMGKILALGRGLEDTLPYLLFLLGIAEPNAPVHHMDPQIRRKRMLEAIKRLMVRESLTQPLLLIFEDLHWLDSETQAFVELLSESVATARILLLVSYRPEYRHAWGSKTYYTQVRLDPLGQAEAEEFLTALLDGKVGALQAALLQDLKRLILEKTEGNPFFMEEIVQELGERGGLVRESEGGQTLELGDFHIPATVHGVLAARIDRLSPDEKAFLQTLAVIGRQFACNLLRSVTEEAEENLYPLLSHLQAKEFIYEQPAFPEVEYTFKHALTQEVAYSSVLIERRKVLHERTAQAIEGLYRDRLDDYCTELAHHYTRSGNTSKAIGYLQGVGQQAAQRSAYGEAISSFTTALDLLPRLHDTPERSQTELSLRVALGMPLIVTKGYTAPEVERNYARARELCQREGPSAHLFPVLAGLRAFYTLRGELRTARELGEQLLHLAQPTEDTSLLLQAHHALGVPSFWLGEFPRAREHLEQALLLYTPQQHRSHTALSAADPAVTCLCFAALLLWHLGYPDQALSKSRDALTLAHELSHPVSLVFALGFTGWLHLWRGEKRRVQEHAEAVLTLSNEHGVVIGIGLGRLLQGWTLVLQGRGADDLVPIREGITAWRKMGVENALPSWLALLAEACGQTGRAADGLEAIAEAFRIAHKNGERADEAELYRLKGKLVLQSAVPSPQSENPRTQYPAPSTHAEVEAEVCFLKAVEIARQQQAKSLELRATVSLAQLWQQQGKREEARQMLAEIYSWFTEGFDTKDVQEAKTLLAALA